MKERLAMLEELQEELEILDELIWEAISKTEEIYMTDFHIGTMLAKITSKLEEARTENEATLSEVLTEIEQLQY